MAEVSIHDFDSYIATYDYTMDKYQIYGVVLSYFLLKHNVILTIKESNIEYTIKSSDAIDIIDDIVIKTQDIIERVYILQIETPYKTISLSFNNGTNINNFINSMEEVFLKNDKDFRDYIVGSPFIKINDTYYNVRIPGYDFRK